MPTSFADLFKEENIFFNKHGKSMRIALLVTIVVLFTWSSCIKAVAAAESKQEPSTAALLPSEIKNAWQLPAFKLKGLDNKVHSLDEWKGKVILLNFWASWCSPCLHEIKEFVKYQKHFKDNNFQIISIGLDSELKLRHQSKKLNINYPVLVLDIEQPSAKQVLAQWGNAKGYIPYSVVINAAGDIHYIHRGKLDEGSFNYYVFPLLKR